MTLIDTVRLTDFGKVHWQQTGKTWCGRDTRYGMRGQASKPDDGWCKPCRDGWWMAVGSIR